MKLTLFDPRSAASTPWVRKILPHPRDRDTARRVPTSRVARFARRQRRATGIATCPALFSPAPRRSFPEPSRGRGRRARADATTASPRPPARDTLAVPPDPPPPIARLGLCPRRGALPVRTAAVRPSRLTSRPLLRGSSSSGAYKYVEELWKKKQSDVLRFLQRVRVWEYRQLPSVVRVTRPTRPDKARRLGYKAKQGFCIYRARVRRGGRKRPVSKGIRYGKPVHQGVKKLKFARNLRSVAEERAARRCGALRVLNSYWLNEDSVYKYYEVIMVDPMHKVVRNDPRINWICNPVHKHREIRGLTAAGRKYRGLGGKGHNYNKARPSKRGTWKRNQKISLKRYR